MTTSQIIELNKKLAAAVWELDSANLKNGAPIRIFKTGNDSEGREQTCAIMLGPTTLMGPLEALIYLTAPSDLQTHTPHPLLTGQPSEPLTDEWTDAQRQRVAEAINLSMWWQNVHGLSEGGNNETIILVLNMKAEWLAKQPGLKQMLQISCDHAARRRQGVKEYILNCGRPGIPQADDWQR